MLACLAAPATAQPSSTAQQAGAVFRDCPECPEMVVIPAGSFVMGAAPGEEDRESITGEWRDRSQPAHRVTVPRFSAGRFEVTRAQYGAFVQATSRASGGCFTWKGDFVFDPALDWRNPGYAQDDRHPVACVSWEDASAYARWLSQRTGRPYRLLTEAEWEYAARAGSTAERYWGEGEHCGHANAADQSTRAKVPYAAQWPVASCDDGHGYTAPSGSYAANAFGLHDMLGNLWEWTQDCWNGNYQGAPADGSGRADGECGMRAVRGGSWEDASASLRAAYRVGSPVVIRVHIRGFRVARDE